MPVLSLFKLPDHAANKLKSAKKKFKSLGKSQLDLGKKFRSAVYTSTSHISPAGAAALVRVEEVMYLDEVPSSLMV
jgi:hypothetical protein